MKNIKEIIIGVFAVIGFVAIVSGFTTNNATQQTTYGTPESHVWQIHSVPDWPNHDWLYNKKTGEVIFIDINSNTKGKTEWWKKIG